MIFELRFEVSKNDNMTIDVLRIGIPWPNQKFQVASHNVDIGAR